MKNGNVTDEERNNASHTSVESQQDKVISVTMCMKRLNIKKH